MPFSSFQLLVRPNPGIYLKYHMNIIVHLPLYRWVGRPQEIHSRGGSGSLEETEVFRSCFHI